MRQVVIAGNWKMNITPQQAREYVKVLKPLVQEVKARVLLAVPYVDLFICLEEAKGSKLEIGAQNVHDEEKGAYTGEISAAMLKEVDVDFVLIGHSERRQYFHETNEGIARKLTLTLEKGITPILCIGEHEIDRELGREKQVLQDQLIKALGSLTAEQLSPLILAYEPVWAIGTGKTATAEMAEATHKMIREMVAERFGGKLADRLTILYGGSVKPDTMSALMNQPDIDGVLVGGASLDPKIFSQIVNFS